MGAPSCPESPPPPSLAENPNFRSQRTEVSPKCEEDGGKGERTPMRPGQEEMPTLPLFRVILPRSD